MSENDQVRDPVINRASEPSIGPPVSPWPGIENHKGSEPLIHRSNDPDTQRAKKPESHRPTDQVHYHSMPDFDPLKKPDDLTPEQFQILHFVVFNSVFKVRSNKGLAIGDRLNPPMTASNVRNRLRSLVNKGYIGKPYSVNDGISQGSSCTINRTKCLPLFEPFRIRNNGPEDHRVIDPLVHSTRDPVANRTIDPETSSYSSSRLLKKTTTIVGPKPDLSDPELYFWLEHGLTEKLVRTWMHEFDLSENSIISSLKYAAFDLVENKRLETIREKLPLNWFYGVLKKKGIISGHQITSLITKK